MKLIGLNVGAEIADALCSDTETDECTADQRFTAVVMKTVLYGYITNMVISF